MNSFEQHGAFSWFELMTTEPEAAQQFYSQLLGWTLEEGPVDGIPYTVVKVGGQEVGGMMGMPPNAPAMPPTWGVYITVENIEETTQKAAELGGKVLMPPHDIPGVGRFSLIQDPQGATFYAITYSAPQQG